MTSDLVQALLRPEAYPQADRPERIHLVETHISWLFFTGRAVYKVKKPVDYGFLDFTTLERRRFFCEEEVRLNRRLSPDVYLGVETIRAQNGGGLALGSDGRVVEYAVKMRQLPDDRWLSGLLRRRQADAPMMRRIARRIAAFHARAETGDHITAAGGIEAVRVNTGENFAQTRDFIGVTLDAPAWDRVRAYATGFLEARRETFAAREREGRIRDCHGDLHADQICIENGIAFIDCIEFNERFRYSDVAADLAFPAMDVEYHGRPDLSAVLVEEYVAGSGDHGVRELLPFYQCYRAFTRGKVRGFRLRQEGLSEAERRAIVDQACRYFRLAEHFARLPGPVLILMSGLMGTGKSTLAGELARRLDAHLLSSDLIRKSLAGVPSDEPRPEAWGSGIYTEDFNRRTYEELHRRAARALAGARSVILDASYREARRRQDARETARAGSAPFLLIETVCPEPIVRSRLESRGAGPSDGRVELLDEQRRRFEPPREIPDLERIVVDTTRPADEVTGSALGEIYRRALAAVRPDASGNDQSTR